MMENDLKTPLTASSLPSNDSIVKQTGEAQEVEALDICQANSSMFIATQILGWIESWEYLHTQRSAKFKGVVVA